jgi:hypothetical protein
MIPRHDFYANETNATTTCKVNLRDSVFGIGCGNVNVT